MIVAPPGDPTARKGVPWSSRMVGLIEDRGRLPGPGRFGSGTPAVNGLKLKSVSSLLSRKPQPGTVMPDPPVCSIVRVYDTALPHLSVTTRWDVDWPSWGGVAPGLPWPHPS